MMTFLVIYIIGVIVSIAINIYAYYKGNEDITLETLLCSLECLCFRG